MAINMSYWASRREDHVADRAGALNSGSRQSSSRADEANPDRDLGESCDSGGRESGVAAASRESGGPSTRSPAEDGDSGKSSSTCVGSPGGDHQEGRGEGGDGPTGCDRDWGWVQRSGDCGAEQLRESKMKEEMLANKDPQQAGYGSGSAPSGGR